MKALGKHIFFDEASDYAWSELNETEFVDKFFTQLREQMGEDFEGCTFYVLSTHKIDVVPQSASIPGEKKVLLFMSDEFSSIPWHLRSSYFAIFKSYLPREVPGTNIFPFHLGYVKGVPSFEPKSVDERGIDLFFSGNLNANRTPLFRAVHPLFRLVPSFVPDRALAFFVRKVLLGRLNLDLGIRIPGSYINFTSGFKAGLSPVQYGSMLADSKIVLCPKGFDSTETFRHMEAIRAGAVVISEQLPDTHFYRNSPIRCVSNWREGVDLAKRLCADPEALRDAQRRTMEWWRDVCSERAAAKFVHEQLGRLMASRTASSPELVGAL